MNRYHSEGGRSNPDFTHRVRVKEVSDEMLHWCSTYNNNKHFERYYVEWLGNNAVFQFETERPALLFNLKFGHL